jgi:hypothetical protein
MYTPPAKEHAARIRCILKFIQNESSLRPHVTSKLVEYWRSWQRNARKVTLRNSAMLQCSHMPERRTVSHYGGATTDPHELNLDTRRCRQHLVLGALEQEQVIICYSWCHIDSMPAPPFDE